jgi:putative ABC transport system permease protein
MGRITTFSIAIANISHQRFRSVCIVLLTALTTLLITGGSWLGFSLRKSIESIDARLGADGMIVPQSASDNFEGALLYGSPSTFYLTTDVADRVMQLDGIERASPQLFIATFDSSHCAALVQIIGYYPATDFVVAPWQNSSKVTQPGDGEIVVGGNINLEIGDQMMIFSVKLNVAGVLEKTGMGFDNSVFVNMDTAILVCIDTRREIKATTSICHIKNIMPEMLLLRFGRLRVKTLVLAPQSRRRRGIFCHSLC